MNAIDLLKQDHDVVDGLFKRIEDTPPSRHPPIFKKIKGELDTHAHIEEKIFYPALKEKGNKELVDITSEGFEEHAQIKKFLKEIARSTSTDKREAKLKVLIEDVRHHVKEEENEMFPMVEDQFSSDELERLGERLEAEKKKFQKAKKITPTRPEPKGTVASVLEKAKEFVAAALTGGATESSARKSPKTASKKRVSGSAPAKSGGAASKASGKASAKGNSSASKRASNGRSDAGTTSGSGGRAKRTSSKKSTASVRSKPSPK